MMSAGLALPAALLAIAAVDTAMFAKTFSE
jgi:hypothetical protein